MLPQTVDQTALDEALLRALEGRRKKPNRLLPALILAALLCAAAAFVFRQQRQEEVDTAAVVYKEITVERGDLTVGVTETGTAAIRSKTLSTDWETTVEAVLVRAGQEVKAGDILIQLSEEDLNDQLTNAEIEFQSAGLSLKEAELARKTGEIDALYEYENAIAEGVRAQAVYDLTISKLHSDLVTAYDKSDSLEEEISTLEEEQSLLKDQYNLDSLESDVADAEELVSELQRQYDEVDDPASEDALLILEALESAKEKQEEAQSAYDKAYKLYQNAYDKNANELESLEESLDKADDDYDETNLNYELEKLKAEQTMKQTLLNAENAELVYQSALTKLEYDYEKARIAYEAAQKELLDLQKLAATGQVAAPFDALVMTVNVEEGDEVSSGSSLLTLMDRATAYFTVSISQEDITSLSLGQEAKVEIEAYDSETLTGVIDSISVSPVRAGASTVNYQVTVLLDETSDQIYEGMSGTVTFVTKEAKDVLLVSNRVVTNKNGATTVLLKGADGQPVETPVETGFSDGISVEIVSGLSEGDVVLLEGTSSQRTAGQSPSPGQGQSGGPAR